ncbi:CC0125/CC1285 family lipoprotein [Candidatus Avelusimicrobium faecicola]|uniref:CC0125/CC1285 family lipoprotein n=1 Tax=Candidatus Avelusimicrobium faecicola TaxID=3416205 RepID=UPI003D0A5931
MKKIIIFCCGFILLTACATPYQRAKKETANGYFDTRLQEGVYDVIFNGNGDTSAKTAHDYALLRSAEVCLENGYKTFDIVSKADHSTQDGYVANNILFMETEPKINFVIHCSKDSDLTFLAEEIKENLRKKYKLQ